VLVTGTEVFKGLVEDRFAPFIREKVERLGSQVVAVDMVPDDADMIARSVGKLLTAGRTHRHHGRAFPWTRTM
jgi:formylmethanofuran dehydrogenase subunit E